jgi:hypothetical protein
MNGWQKCPVCDGTGLVSRPPWIAGDLQEFSTSSAGPWPCKRCAGVGTILEPILYQGEEEKT